MSRLRQTQPTDRLTFYADDETIRDDRGVTVAEVYASDAIGQLLAASPDLLAACKQAEWGNTVTDDLNNEYEACPVCGFKRREGHAESCELSAAIARVNGKSE